MKRMVYILLATYNGEKYLREQLDSIINQTYTDWKLIIADDQSNDKTVEIIEEYEKRDSRIIHYINKQNLRAMKNFGHLTSFVKIYMAEQNSDNAFFMFSDQDDVWKSDKVEKSLVEIQKYDSKLPQLVYTSKQYVNSTLQSIKFDIKNENKINFKINLHQNQTFGCTHIINKALLEKLVSEPELFFENYDYYVLIQALIYGQVHFLNEKTILYRQHGDNVTGSVIERNFIQKIDFLKKYRDKVSQYRNLINYCYQHLDDLQNDEDKKLINELYKYIGSRFLLFISSIKNGVKRNTKIASLQFYLTMLFG